MRKLWILAIVAALAGCQTKDAKAPETAAREQANQTGAQAKVEEKAPPPPPVPDELKKDAFEYYGLGNSKPIKMSMVFSNSTQKLEGEVVVRQVESKDGAPRFRVERTGGLASLPGATLLLRSDGLYVEALDNGEVPKPVLELPNGLAPGKRWTTSNEFTLQGRKLKDNSTYVVRRVEKVKVPAGEFEALLIEGQGELIEDGQKSTAKMRSWYVKGLGSVKMEVERKVSGQKDPVKVTVEAVSVGQ
ncbi:MAG: hypothetical protein N2109_06440 [Fimbriimonadales bacterium]|nr:hypothetical protein [Fimbriimonadales bacterium]